MISRILRLSGFHGQLWSPKKPAGIIYLKNTFSICTRRFEKCCFGSKHFQHKQSALLSKLRFDEQVQEDCRTIRNHSCLIFSSHDTEDGSNGSSSRSNKDDMQFLPDFAKSKVAINFNRQLPLPGHFFQTEERLSSLPWRLQSRGFASRAKRPSKGKKRTDEDTDDDDDDDDDAAMTRYEDDLERDWDPERDEESVGDEEEVAKKDWKDVRQHVPSLRLDAVLGAGLGISRKKVEDAYLSTRLRVNGEKVTKKSKQVKEGDILDIILERGAPSQSKDGESNNDEISVMRIHIKEISADKTGKDRVPVLLRRWKNLKITK